MAIEDANAGPAPDVGGHEHDSSDGLSIIRAAMEQSFAGVVVTDAAGVIELVNRSFETTSGYCAAELIGRPIAGLSTDADLEQEIGAALSAGGQWRGEIRNKRADGEECWILASIQPLRSDDGEIRHYVGINIDITERVRVEEELAESEAYWRALVENAPDLIVVVDEDGVVSRLNRAPAGSTMEDAVGRLVYDFVLPESHEAWRKGLAEVFATGRYVEFEVTANDVRGRARWYAVMLGAVRDGDSVVAAVASMRDVTRRKQAEEGLAEREAYWRALVENAPDHILTVDRDGVITSLNWTLPGTTVEEAVGRTVYDFVQEPYHDAWREALAEVFGGGKRVEFEVRTVGGPEEPQWYANTVGPVYDGETVVAAIVSSRNVTARKEAEEELADREAHWRALVENAPDHILTVDEDGVITSLNRSVPGTTVDDVVGRTVYDFVREEYQDVWREALADVFAGGQRVEFEVRTFDLPGETQSYAITLSAVCEGDTVVAGIASIRNVTTLKEAEERMRAIATAVSDVIVVVDGDGVLLEVLAPTMKEGLLVVLPDDLRGRRVDEFLPHDQVELALGYVRETIATGRPREAEVLLDLPQGPTWLSARSAPLSLGDERVVAVVHVADIGERKLLEEELQRLREEMETVAEEGVKRAAGYGLTFREITVLSQIARGKSDKEIAVLLGLSPFTVNKHSSNVVHKMGARSRSQAAARAVREGII